MNRTRRIVRQSDSASPDEQTLERYVIFDETTADATLAFAQGLEARGNFRCEFLFDAEREMRNSIERLRAEEFAPATEHQSEALALLIKARSDMRAAFGKSPSSAACQKFDREQIQKLRKPKDEDEQVELLAEKLEELAEEEEFVYATLGGVPVEQGSPSPSKSPSTAQTSAESNKTDQPSEQETPEGDQESGQSDDSEKPEGEPAESPSEGQEGTEGSTKQSRQEGDTGEGQKTQQGDGKQADGRQGQSSTGQSGTSPQEADGQGTGKKDASESAGDDDQPSGRQGGEGEEGTGKPLDRRGLEQLQHEIVLDAHEVQRMMSGLDGMTELAQSRMARSTKRAEDASGALARGDTDEARKAAGEASGMFKELARHVAGLSARDLAGKIGNARDLSSELAHRERGLADRLDQDAPPGAPSQGAKRNGDGGTSEADSQSKSPSGKQPGQQGQAGEGQGGSGRGRGTDDGESKGSGGGVSDDLADESERLAQGGLTLQDFLDALARDPEAEGELVSKITIVRERAGLGGLVGQMEAIQRRLRDQKPAGVQRDARDLADRLEALAHELDGLHGEIIAPRLNQLIALEKQAAELLERLAKLASDTEISQWHLDAQGLIQALEKADVDGAAVEALREAMIDAGWGKTRPNWQWDYVVNDVLGGYHYTAPGAYHLNLTTIVEDIQEEARELLLRDLMASSEEAVPPQYEKLVDRYFEVLSHERTD